MSHKAVSFDIFAGKSFVHRLYLSYATAGNINHSTRFNSRVICDCFVLEVCYTMGTKNTKEYIDMSHSISIADCQRCACIPQKVSSEQGVATEHNIPPQVKELGVVLDMWDNSTHRYCTSNTRLLKCTDCGTYYYYNHYDDDGEYFMDLPSDTITVRRYDPLTALDFLEHIAGGQGDALPKTLGQMTKAFAEGTTVPATQIAGSDLNETVRIALQEIGELNSRYDALMEDLAHLLGQTGLNWHIQRYAIEARLNHLAVRSDWATIEQELLQHPDPVVRLTAARMVISIGTDDAPAIDYVHTTQAMRQALAIVVAQKAPMRRLVEILLDISLSNEGTTWEYDHSYGNSKYSQASTRWVALYGLVVAAGHRGDLLPAVQPLLGLLSTDDRLNSRICWVLSTLAEKRKKGAQAIMDGLESFRGRG